MSDEQKVRDSDDQHGAGPTTGARGDAAADHADAAVPPAGSYPPPVGPPRGASGFPPPVGPPVGAGGFPPPVGPPIGAGGFPSPVGPPVDAGGFPPPVGPPIGAGGFPSPVGPPVGAGPYPPPAGPSFGTPGTAAGSPHGGPPAVIVGPRGVKAKVAARFGAWLLDGLVICLPALVAYSVVIAAGAAIAFGGFDRLDSDRTDGDVGLTLFTLLAVPIVLTVVSWLYAMPLMRRSGVRNGETLGGAAASVRVARTDGQPVGAGLIFRREVLFRNGPPALVAIVLLVVAALLEPTLVYDDDYGYQVSRSTTAQSVTLILLGVVEIAWYAVALGMALIDPYGRTLWDRWARTVVVTAASTPYGPPLRPFPGLGRDDRTVASEPGGPSPDPSGGRPQGASPAPASAERPAPLWAPPREPSAAGAPSADSEPPADSGPSSDDAPPPDGEAAPLRLRDDRR